VIASIIGIVTGIKNKKIPLVILSVIGLIFTITVWIYFYNNPY
jgi:uncharacterized membrane protein (Fun14 family)